MTEYPSRRALRENPDLVWTAPVSSQEPKAAPAPDELFDQDSWSTPPQRPDVPRPAYQAPASATPLFDQTSHDTGQFESVPHGAAPFEPLGFDDSMFGLPERSDGPLESLEQVVNKYNTAAQQTVPAPEPVQQPQTPASGFEPLPAYVASDFPATHRPVEGHQAAAQAPREDYYREPAATPAPAPAPREDYYRAAVAAAMPPAPTPREDYFREPAPTQMAAPVPAPPAAYREGRQPATGRLALMHQPDPENDIPADSFHDRSGLLEYATGEYESESGISHGAAEQEGQGADSVRPAWPERERYDAHEGDGSGVEHHYEDYDYVDELVPEEPRGRKPASKRVRKRRRSLVFLVILLLFIGVVYFVFQTVKPMLGGFQTPDYPGPGTGAVSFVVPDGSTGRSIATDLKGQDIVQSEQAFLDALQAVNGAAALQPGTFDMKHQMKASDVVSILLAADDAKVHYAAVAQNLRIGETLKVLADGTGIPVKEFEDLANQPALFDLPPQAKNLEGYLAPGEYRFPVELDAKGILTELVNTTKKELTDTGVTDPNEQYRILTVGSIVEFEGNEANYAKISGAIENRINKPNEETGGRLESDATVAYGLGKKTYNITAEEKADASNLYNTFANPGLPVGPIGSPANKAIVAAAHPEENPYYFWVTVNLDTGETLYAATFAEHQANVAKYVAWCDANAGKCD